MKIGGNIRKFRDLKGYSQQALANDLQISQKQLSRIENNETSPTVDLVEKICEKLGVKLKALLEFKDEMVFNSCTESQSDGEFFAYSNTDIRQVLLLYKQLLNDKNKIIILLEEKLKKQFLSILFVNDQFFEKYLM